MDFLYHKFKGLYRASNKEKSFRGIESLFTKKPIQIIMDNASVNFTKLFIKKHYPPPPYESVYEGRSFGETTKHVRQYYSDIGILI